ncbi:hypothetical protein ACP275_09G061200 [Erythranthe tilingii]
MEIPKDKCFTSTTNQIKFRFSPTSEQRNKGFCNFIYSNWEESGGFRQEENQEKPSQFPGGRVCDVFSPVAAVMRGGRRRRITKLEILGGKLGNWVIYGWDNRRRNDSLEFPPPSCCCTEAEHSLCHFIIFGGELR